MGKTKKLTKEDFIDRVRDFYFHNGKINVRDFKSLNNLPSIQYIDKHFRVKSIVDIMKFCKLQVNDNKVNLANRKKYTIEDVSKIFKERNCTLLSKTLENGIFSSVFYICECGEYSKVKLSDFINKDIRCLKCGIKKNAEHRRIPLKELKNIFENHDCELLSDYKEYKNKTSLLKFRCKCGAIDYKSLSAFQLTPHCKKCNKTIKLENHYCWKGGVTPLHEYLRRHLNEWKRASMKSCNYKCDITGERFQVIHHLYNFSDIVKETLKEVQLDYKEIGEYTEEELFLLVETCNKLHNKYGLGVCLTKDLHKEFHSIYGIENNTPKQYYDFKEKKLNNKQ
ncbi:TPA: hypothetical protein I9089_002389 [Clostridium perfringens]|nr:hypothetical protein [Clostridium perfringens]